MIEIKLVIRATAEIPTIAGIKREKSNTTF